MANGIFETGIGGPSGSPVQPMGGVTDSSSAQLLDSLSRNIPSILGTVANGYAATQQAQKKQEQLDQRNAIMSGYAQKTAALNAAVEQGKMSWDAAKMRQRALYNQTIANFPSLVEDITKFQGDLNSTAGLGDVLAKGTAVDQQLQDDTKKATAAGFVSASMSPEEQQAGVQRYKDLEHNLYNMNYQKNQLQLQAAQLEIVSKRESIAASRANRANAELERKMKLTKLNVQNNLADVNTVYFDKIRTDVQGVINNEQLTGEQKVQAITDIRNNYTAVLNRVRAAGDPNYVDSLTKPTFDMIENSLNFANGKVSKEVAQNNIDKLTAVAQNEIMRNPVLATAAAASKLFPQFSEAIITQVSPDVIQVLRKNTQAGNAGSSVNTTVPANLVDPDNQAEVKTYLKGIGDVATRIQQKDPTVTDPKGALQDLNANVNNILKGINAFSLSVEKPSQLNNIANFLASKDFINFQKAGGQINASNTEAVKGIVQEQYNNQVIPAIRKEWEASKTTVGYPTGVKQVGRVAVPVQDTKETVETVQYRWTGNSVTFLPAKGMEQNRGANAKARELNAKVAPLINRMIRMNAHLDGSEDYAKYFKDEEAAIFGVEGTVNE